MEDREYIALRQLEDRYWWLEGLRRLACSMLLAHARLVKGGRMLDIGCGTGGTLAYLGTRIEATGLYGVDNHPLAIELARERQVGTLLRGTAEALPFRDGIFDAALSLDVFYARGVDDVRALCESHRVLARGGILVVNLPAFEMLRGRHDLAVNTRHRYTAGELHGKLAAAGFEVVRMTYWNMFLAPLVFVKRRVLGRGQGAELPRSDLALLPACTNAFLAGILRIELGLISRMDLPFGSSVFAVARKPRGRGR